MNKYFLKKFENILLSNSKKDKMVTSLWQYGSEQLSKAWCDYQFHQHWAVRTTCGSNNFFCLISGYARPYLLNYDIAPSKLTPADLTNNTITRAVVGVIIKNHYFSLLPITVQSDAIISVSSFYISLLQNSFKKLSTWINRFQPIQ